MDISNEFLTKISGKIPDEALKIVKIELDIFLSQFEISRRETHLAAYSPVPECVKTYLVTKKIEGKSEETLKLYSFQLKKFFLEVNKPFEDIKKEDVLLYLHKREGASVDTLNNIRLCLNAFYNWAVDNEYIKSSPVKTIPVIKGTKNIRKPLTETEVELVRDAIDNREKILKKATNLKTRDKALFEFLYSTGARVSEVARCNIEDVDFSTKTVIVFGKGSKERKTYLNTKAEYYLKKYLEERKDDSPALFVSSKKPYERLSKAGIEKIIKNYGNLIGIRCYPHKIRHTTATQGLKHGMVVTDLQKLLGHEKVETTLIYAEISDMEVKYNHQKYITG